MSSTTHRRIKTEDGEKFKIVYHGAANFSYIELHQYDGEQFNEIEDWDLRTAEIEGTNVRNASHTKKKKVATRKAKTYITEWLEKDIATEKVATPF